MHRDCWQPGIFQAWVLVWAFVCLCGGLIHAQTEKQERAFEVIERRYSTDRYYEELRQRGLYVIAELAAGRELRSGKLSPHDELVHRIQLARTHQQHATSVSWQDAVELYQLADEVLTSPGPLQSRLDLEKLLIKVARSRQMHALLSFYEPADPFVTEYLELVQQNYQQLSALMKTYNDSEYQTFQKHNSSAVVDRNEFLLAQGESALLLAEWFRGKAEIRDGWISACQSALRGVSSPVFGGHSSGRAQLLLISAARIGGRAEEFERLVRDTRARNDNPLFIPWIEREVAQFLLDSGQPTAAAQQISEYEKTVDKVPAMLELIRLEALCEMSVQVARKGDRELARRLLNEVQRRIEQLMQAGETFSAYRARRLYELAVAAQLFDPELMQQVQQARSALQNRDSTSALNFYQAAIDLARQSGRPEQYQPLAEEILARSAGLNDFRRTAEMIYQLWLASPSYPGMESVHLGWIELLEQQYRKQPSLELLEQYRAGLNEHRTRYAQQKTFPAVVWKSAELARASGDQRSAMQLFYQIPETNSQALKALARIGLCWEELLERNPPPADLTSSQREAIQFANQQLQQFNNEWLTSADALELFTLSTRLLLKYETGLHPVLNEQLRKIEETVSRQSQSQQAADMIALTNLWQRRIRTLQLFLAVQEGRSADVLALTKTLQEAPHSYDELLVLLESLPESRDPLQRQLSGLVSLRLIQLFHAQESTTGLPKEVQDNLKAREAEAEIALGRISAGVEIYQKLIPGRSASDRLVQRLSTLLKECGNAECHQQRYQLWTGVSQKAQAGSEDWLRARYELADAAWDAGKTEEAQKILQVTQLLYPDAGTPELKLLGQKLEQKLAAGNRK